MLSFVKNMFKNDVHEHEAANTQMTPAARRAPDVAQLRPGAVLRFGFMPVADLSRKALTVTDFNTYVFDKIQFTSFVLQQDEDDSLFLIIGEDEGVKYLVLSRRLPEPFARELLNHKPLKEAARSALGKTMELTAEQVEKSQGWMRTAYTSQVLNMRGQFYRHGIRGNAGAQDAFDIDYMLFVSDDEECAIEVEKHSNDEVHVFATLYRPISDILEIAPPPPPSMHEPHPEEEPEEKAEDAQEAVSVTAAPVIEHRPAALEDVANDIHPGIKEAIEEIEEIADRKPEPDCESKAGAAEPEEAAPVPETAYQPEFFEAELPEESAPEVAAVEFDVKVAGKLIDEAQKNKIPLAELVRKVIDLPKSVPEKVEIKFPLNDEDYLVLAQRYDLDPSDREQIRQCIVRELLHFTGES